MVVLRRLVMVNGSCMLMKSVVVVFVDGPGLGVRNGG